MHSCSCRSVGGSYWGFVGGHRGVGGSYWGFVGVTGVLVVVTGVLLGVTFCNCGGNFGPPVSRR